ncbi:hypothetical protein KC947_03760 [Candidatus Saccharibacteria bacterium]|nr:hypothetical protein [Candidatus Saccharibacteria bacterium]
MAKAYFIGGAPRAGKTTALKELVRQKSLLAASSDAIRYTIRGVLEADNNQDLFKIARGKFDSPENIANMQNNPTVVVDHQNRESEVVWKSVLDFVKSNIEVGQDIGVEGVAILPHNFATELSFEHKVVFIVNLHDQTETILRHAHENTFDWLHKYDDEIIRAFCIFNLELNKYYFEEAKKYDLPVVTVGDNFRQSVDAAIKILIN